MSEELDDLTIARRELESHRVVINERFEMLEEIVMGYEQQIAGLMTGYVELTAIVDAVFNGIQNMTTEDGLNDLKLSVEALLRENRSKMMDLLRGVNEQDMETGDRSPVGSVEDVVGSD